MPRPRLPWTQELVKKDGLPTFTIATNERGGWDSRPIIELLPHRVKNIELIKGSQYKPVIADNFILVPMCDELLPMKGNRRGHIPIRGDFEEGETFKIVFRATPVSNQRLTQKL